MASRSSIATATNNPQIYIDIFFGHPHVGENFAGERVERQSRSFASPGGSDVLHAHLAVGLEHRAQGKDGRHAPLYRYQVHGERRTQAP